MSEIKVNSISPSTAGTTTITIDAQVSGVPGTEPNHFVTLGQLGQGSQTIDGVSQGYVNEADAEVLSQANAYSTIADAAALQLANSYTDIHNNLLSGNFYDSLAELRIQMDNIGAKLGSVLFSAWTEMNPTLADATKIRLLTKKEEIVVSTGVTDSVTGELISKTPTELAALGIYENDSLGNLHLSIIISTGGDGLNPLDGSLPATAVLLIGEDLDTISKDFNVSTTPPSTSYPPTSTYINGYSKRTSASTYTLFSIVPSGYYYRVVVTDHAAGKEQVLVSWQELGVV